MSSNIYECGNITKTIYFKNNITGDIIFYKDMNLYDFFNILKKIQKQLLIELFNNYNEEPILSNSRHNILTTPFNNSVLLYNNKIITFIDAEKIFMSELKYIEINVINNNCTNSIIVVNLRYNKSYSYIPDLDIVLHPTDTINDFINNIINMLYSEFISDISISEIGYFVNNNYIIIDITNGTSNIFDILIYINNNIKYYHIPLITISYN